MLDKKDVYVSLYYSEKQKTAILDNIEQIAVAPQLKENAGVAHILNIQAGEIYQITDLEVELPYNQDKSSVDLSKEGLNVFTPSIKAKITDELGTFHSSFLDAVMGEGSESVPRYNEFDDTQTLAMAKAGDLLKLTTQDGRRMHYFQRPAVNCLGGGLVGKYGEDGLEKIRAAMKGLPLTLRPILEDDPSDTSSQAYRTRQGNFSDCRM